MQHGPMYPDPATPSPFGFSDGQSWIPSLPFGVSAHVMMSAEATSFR